MPGTELALPGQPRPGADFEHAQYIEYAPEPGLAPHVECFWTRASPADPAGRPYRVLPDGCADVIFTFGVQSPPAMAVGTMTRPLVFRPTPRTSLLGVRFRPGVAGAALGLPASELTDERVALHEVWRDSSELVDSVEDAPDTRTRIRILSRAIARRLLASPVAAPPPAVTAATSLIEATRGNVSIAALSEAVGVTRQHLARAFARHVGISPKTLARVVRARSVLARVARGSTDVDWSALALDAGYYDQSHFIADFGELTGLTPTAWLAERA